MGGGRSLKKSNRFVGIFVWPVFVSYLSLDYHILTSNMTGTADVACENYDE